MHAAVMGLALLAAGCGDDLARVTGQITRADGTPVVGALVVARAESIGKSATGQTDGEGRYALGGAEPGGGVVPGDYAVIIIEERQSLDGGGQRTFPARYGDYAKSGLTFSAAAGDSHEFNIQLEAE